MKYRSISQSAVEDPENINVAGGVYQISYAVILVEQDPYFARLFSCVSMTQPRMISE
jgi:hypothetical protein